MSVFFSFMKNTLAAAKMSKTPAIPNIAIELSSAIYLNNTPPRTAAIICGKQIVPLKSPKYAPKLSPFKAFVKRVNGSANIADHAHPINK